MSEKEAVKRLRRIESDLTYMEKFNARRIWIYEPWKWWLAVLLLLIMTDVYISVLWWAMSWQVAGAACIIFLLLGDLLLIAVMYILKERQESRYSERKWNVEQKMKERREEKERILSVHPELKGRNIGVSPLHPVQIMEILSIITLFIWISITAYMWHTNSETYRGVFSPIAFISLIVYNIFILLRWRHMKEMGMV